MKWLYSWGLDGVDTRKAIKSHQLMYVAVQGGGKAVGVIIRKDWRVEGAGQK
jgi:hypothetical protein